MITRVGINGFGRIGCNFFCVILEQGADIGVIAANGLTGNKALAYLLKYDSTLGRFDGEVFYDEDDIAVNGKHIKALTQCNPVDLPWGDLSVKVVVESTGFFTGGEKAKAHLDGGTKKIVTSAPVKNVDGTLITDVNEGDRNNVTMNTMLSASCTTNCLAPLAKALHENFGIERGIMATVHSYIDGQRVPDVPHSDLRRVRAAVLSMTPAKTSTAQAMALILSALKDRFGNLVVHVPTSTGSLTDLAFIAEEEVSVEAVKATAKAVVGGELKGALEHTEDPVVSTDVAGNPHTSIFDAIETKVIGNLVKALSRHDNERDYSDALAHLTSLVSSKFA